MCLRYILERSVFLYQKIFWRHIDMSYKNRIIVISMEVGIQQIID